MKIIKENNKKLSLLLTILTDNCWSLENKNNGVVMVNIMIQSSRC